MSSDLQPVCDPVTKKFPDSSTCEVGQPYTPTTIVYAVEVVPCDPVSKKTPTGLECDPGVCDPATSKYPGGFYDCEATATTTVGVAPGLPVTGREPAAGAGLAFVALMLGVAALRTARRRTISR